MSTYKITNITNTAGKRDFKFNSELSIEFIDNMIKKNISVKPGDSVFLTVQSLPLSVHRLRVKGLVTVSEISEVELAKTINEVKPKKAKKPVDEVIIPEDESVKKLAKKRTGKKETEE